MDSIPNYPWLTPLYQQLVQQHQRGVAHHARLLIAPFGCGLEHLLYQLARWILCQKPQSNQPCDHCHACLLMAAQSHPDYRQCSLVADKQQLGIESIRQLLPWIYQHAQQCGAKVIGLLACERLSEAAVNALLKVVEEPPPDTYFLLVCHQQQALPITLRSRCQSWLFKPPAPAVTVAWLQQQVPKLTLADATLALQLSEGAPLAAQQLLVDKGLAEYPLLLEALQAALQQQHLPLLLPQLDQPQVVDQLAWLAMLWLEAAKQQQGLLVSPIFKAQQAIIGDLVKKGLSLSQWLNGVQQILRCRYQLLTIPGINQTLLLAELLHRQQELWLESGFG
ncbi:MAG: DNA polymerase III subunit delta' C-terminal domain-containing protein [Candidatus Symbiodolus clandestinus]